jgi:hypothetical protein
MYGGSQTAERLRLNENLDSALETAGSLATGHTPGIMRSGAKMVMRRLRRNRNDRVNMTNAVRDPAQVRLLLRQILENMPPPTTLGSIVPGAGPGAMPSLLHSLAAAQGSGVDALRLQARDAALSRRLLF